MAVVDVQSNSYRSTELRDLRPWAAIPAGSSLLAPVLSGASAPLTFSAITPTENFTVLGSTGTLVCVAQPGVAVLPGGNCTLDVAFAPTVGGSLTGTLTLDDNGIGSPHVIPLSGTGLAPAVSLSLLSLTFASQLSGTTSAATVITVSNNGNQDLNFTGIVSTGDFAVVSSGTGTPACAVQPGVAVPPGGNCALNVTFKPAAGGTRTGTLTNSGNAPLAISGITVGGTNSGDFGALNTCNGAVAADANCQISVTFKPTATGSRTASVSIADNASGSPQTISLTGMGVPPVTPASTYTLTITATLTTSSGTLTRTVPLTLTVN